MNHKPVLISASGINTQLFSLFQDWVKRMMDN